MRPASAQAQGSAPVNQPGYALALDALDDPGPAAPSRFPRRVCLSPLMPGVNRVRSKRKRGCKRKRKKRR